MHKTLRILLALLPLLAVARAFAVASFARQTGLSCNVCHSNPPELTAFGRKFKLNGYVLTDVAAKDKVGDSKDLLLSKYIPLSAMILLSDTAYQANQPSSQNNTAGFPQQVSLFLGGGFASHFGGLAQITYPHTDDHFSMDNTDLRYANQTKVEGHDLTYGVTLNNNPTVEDLWNSTPAWGFPWISSASALSPIASPVINGGLGGDVAGVGGYGMWANHLYTALTVYRTEHQAAPPLLRGRASSTTSAVSLHTGAPRGSRILKGNYFEVGTYGIYVSSFPNAISGPRDRYVDPAFDFQFERPLGSNLVDAHGTYIHEKSELRRHTGAEEPKRSLTPSILSSWTLRITGPTDSPPRAPSSPLPAARIRFSTPRPHSR